MGSQKKQQWSEQPEPGSYGWPSGGDSHTSAPIHQAQGRCV